MGGVISHGIDTSKWQASKVNYQLAKMTGIDFVFLRIGYNKTLDKCFEHDYAAAKEAGMKIGVYFYPLSTTKAEAVADATRVLGWLNNRHLDYPVVYDVEDAKQKKLTKEQNSELYNAFADKIKANGRYGTMLYTYENFYLNYFKSAAIKDPLWIAQYSRKPEIGRIVSLWQYSSDPVNTCYYKGKLDVNFLLVSNLKSSNDNILEFVSLNPYPVPARIIKKALVMQKGDDVKWVQWELAQKRYLKEKDIDGKWWNISDAALRLYQKDHGLLVDGKCGPATRYSMLND